MLTINSLDTWMPSRGAYDVILEEIATELRSTDPELADIVEGGLSKNAGLCQLDLSAVTPTQLQEFLVATQRHMDRVFAWPPATPGLFGRIRLMSQLEAVLRLDPRIAEPEPDGELIVPAGATWRASGWIYDLVLAHLAATLKDDVGTSEAQAWAEQIMAARVRLGATRCDLHELPESLHKAYTKAVAYLVARLGGGGGLDTVSPRFDEDLPQPLAALNAVS